MFYVALITKGHFSPVFLTRCQRGIFPNSQCSPNGQWRANALDGMTLRRLTVVRKGIRCLMLWACWENFDCPNFCSNIAIYIGYIAIYCSCAILCDFKKSFFWCILDAFTLFFMLDCSGSFRQWPKLAFFEILLSKMIKFR